MDYKKILEQEETIPHWEQIPVKKKKRDYSILKHPIVAGTTVGLILAAVAWLSTFI